MTAANAPTDPSHKQASSAFCVFADNVQFIVLIMCFKALWAAAEVSLLFEEVVDCLKLSFVAIANLGKNTNSMPLCSETMAAPRSMAAANLASPPQDTSACSRMIPACKATQASKDNERSRNHMQDDCGQWSFWMIENTYGADH